MITNQQREIIKKCQQSIVYFLNNFGYTKHPSAGVIPFKPFKYQVMALKAFRSNRFNIFRKCRQSGASKISGAFALWFALFFSHKTVLIVSRKDDDAMSFLADNIKFVYDHLPDWMKQLWKPVTNNEHEMEFPNGSKIRSLTSNADVLRSNASSLNIIDECAFIENMSAMWAAGYPTLQHGGSVICISTTNGVGNWYWGTWMDAEASLNDFNAININWWDMDWSITYRDVLSGKMKTLAPTNGIRKCTTPEEIEKYGPYWSPWLEQQYRNLQERGEAWKFEQEILAKFVGSGNTVIDPKVLAYIQTTINDKYQKVKGEEQYNHPALGQRVSVYFNGGVGKQLGKDEGLWVWETPNRGRKPVIRGKQVIEPGEHAHRYTAGVDLATGKGKDYFAMEVFDIDTQEQVAEIMIRTIPRVFKYIVDYIGRWYNNALLVVERNNGGDAFIDELREDLMYPNLWRKVTTNDKPSKNTRANPVHVAEYGFFTSGAGKPKLNKTLHDFLRPDGSGFTVYSRRLCKQLNTYVRKKDKAGRDTDKTEAEEGNYDDLVIATGLAFIGSADAATTDDSGLLPYMPQSMSGDLNEADANKYLQSIANKDPKVMIPIHVAPEEPLDQSIMAELAKFAQQLGVMPLTQETPNVTQRRHSLMQRRQ